MSSSPSAPQAEQSQAEEFPEDPRFRTMRRLVSILLVVLIAGTLSVVIALVLKLKSTSFASTDAGAVSIGLRADEQLVGAQATSERITLTIERRQTGARRVVILDAQDYRVIGTIAAEETPQE